MAMHLYDWLFIEGCLHCGINRGFGLLESNGELNLVDQVYKSNEDVLQIIHHRQTHKEKLS